MTTLRLPPPVLAVGAGLAQRALTRGATRPTPARLAAAGVVATGSATLLAGSLTSFRGLGTTIDPFHPADATALVTTGPNAWTRNPMYVGMAGLLTAHAVVRGAWPAVAPIVVFVLAIDRLQIAAEENALLARFGADYEAYRARVPRWWGHLAR